MLIKEIIDYFKTKNEHYPISDGFIKSGYQQQGGGYINKAKKRGLEIDYKKQSQTKNGILSILTH
jgi:hypothetical protein